MRPEELLEVGGIIEEAAERIARVIALADPLLDEPALRATASAELWLAAQDIARAHRAGLVA
jgi:hypothetical protein